MFDAKINKSDLIDNIALRIGTVSEKDTEEAVKLLIEKMSDTLANNDRIEIRGFGSFSLNHRAARIGRNPKTGEAVSVGDKYVPHFKPGKELRERVDAAAQ